MNRIIIRTLVIGITAFICVNTYAGEKVELCHAPSGNLDKAHTIIVGVKAQASHEAHGDSLGACKEDVSACPCNDANSGEDYGWNDTIDVSDCTIGESSANLYFPGDAAGFSTNLSADIYGDNSGCVITEYLFLDISEVEAIACKNDIIQFSLNDSVTCDTF